MCDLILENKDMAEDSVCDLLLVRSLQAAVRDCIELIPALRRSGIDSILDMVQVIILGRFVSWCNRTIGYGKC
jgi:hypothetical protein